MTTQAIYPSRLISSAPFCRSAWLWTSTPRHTLSRAPREIMRWAKKAQVQIERHMRICIGTPDERAPVRSIAASEPILSEAASLVMRGNYNFNLPDALLNVLDAYVISHGDRGELLVAAFFTRARDLLVRQITKDNSFLMHQSVVLSRRWTYSLISSTKRLLVSCWIQCHRSVAPIFLRKSSGRCS